MSDIIDLIMKNTNEENADLHGKIIAEITNLRKDIKYLKEEKAKLGWHLEYNRNHPDLKNEW